MKVLLNLDKLLAEGKITESEYKKLRVLASEETTSLAFNGIIGFGVIAVSGATIALLPSPLTVILLGLLIGVVGLVSSNQPNKWHLLGTMCNIIGCLVLCGGILWQFSGSTFAWISVTCLLAAVGIITCHGLTIVLSMLALSAALDVSTMYSHALYTIMVNQPLMTIVVFSSLAIGLYKLVPIVPLHYQHLPILAARTAIFLINLAFWVGSLWGDKLVDGSVISNLLFIITWCLALIITAIWAVHHNRRWLLNTCFIFGAIHFYTQWFERLGATPAAVLLAGLLALGFALLIRYINQYAFETNNTNPTKT